MKISVRGDKIIVRSFWKVRFAALAKEVTRVSLMGSYDYRLPSIFVRLRHKKATLRYLLIEAGQSNVTLDAARDGGFEQALSWLKDEGWNIEPALNDAVIKPYIRVTVAKLRSY
jgi:hypothetical protein